MITKPRFRILLIALFAAILLFQKCSCGGMKITKDGGSYIRIDTARNLIRQFQEHYRLSNFPYPLTVNTGLIKNLLQAKGAANLRFYYAKDPATKAINIVVVPVDDNGLDIQSEGCLLITKSGTSKVSLSSVALLTHQFQKDYAKSDFPFAEKFNSNLINDGLLRLAGAVQLHIYLGEDRNNMLAKDIRGNNLKKIRMVLFAVDARGGDIVNRSARLGRLRTKNPEYIMVNNFVEDGSGLENGQQCLSLCDVNSALYRAN